MAEETQDEQRKKDTGRLHCCAVFTDHRCLLFGVYYFTEHFLPGTQVNGFNCSYMTQEETEKLLAEETSVYILAIQTEETVGRVFQQMRST